MEHVPVLRPDAEYRSRDTEELRGVDGQPLAEVSQAPPMLAGRVLRQLSQRAGPAGPELAAVLAEAGRLFGTATLGGETPEEYARRHCLATGVPVAVARGALRALPGRMARLAEVVDAQRPAGAGRQARWVPRAGVLGVIAPSNHPLTHVGWLQALALGYSVAVRPGSRDPFTPTRLGRALRQAGLPGDRLAVLPGPHATGQAVLEQAGLGLVYGDEPAVARYRGSTRYLVRGPGRSKALVLGPGEPAPDRYHHLVTAVAADGGVRCTNVSAVLVEGDHTTVAEELARRLGKLPSLPVWDAGAVLPARAAPDAARLRQAVAGLVPGAVDVSAQLGDHPLAVMPDGQAVLRPAVLRVDRPDAPLTAELPFPCVWVAPWRRAAGTAALRDSLAVQVLGPGGPAGDDPVLPELLAEPSVRTVVDGPSPGWWEDPELPHDGYLGHFLYEARGHAGAGARC